MIILLGSFPAVESLVYVVVGLAGLYEMYLAYQLSTALHRPYRAPHARTRARAGEVTREPPRPFRPIPDSLATVDDCRHQP